MILITTLAYLFLITYLFTVSTSKFKEIVYKRFRCLQWLPKYNRTYFISDLIAGITVGLTLMPQSIAYASIAELPPHVGLYTALMGSFIYIFFGTIKQVSIGPSSILSLLTYTYVQGLGIDFVVLLTFLAGCVELTLGILNLGIVVDFIPAPVMSAFTSATSCVIILAQLKNIFGIKFKSVGVLDLIIKLFSNLRNLRIADTILGLSSMIVLLGVKRFTQRQFANAKVNKALWLLSICRNALTVFIGSVLAFTLEHLYGYQPFIIAGKITPGLPTFKLPNFSTQVGNDTYQFTDMIATLNTGIIVLPVVAILANVAIAKTFAEGTVFDATQEMMTLGLSNIMGSFVGAMPTTGAFTRSAVNNASHVQTPLGGLYAGTMILLALSYLTPYFYYIPKSTIAAVLICAVAFMVEYQEVPKLWRCNKYDFFIGMFTFCISLYFGVEIGLVIGVALNVCKLLKYWARPKINSELISKDKENEYVLVTPELGFFFPAANYFMAEMLHLLTKYDDIPIVLDMKSFIRIDYTAIVCMKSILGAYKKQSRKLILLNVSTRVLERLKSQIDIDEMDVRTSIDQIYEEKHYNEAETPLLDSNILYYNNELAHRKTSIYDSTETKE